MPDPSAEVARLRVASAADTAGMTGHLPQDPHLLPAPAEWFAPDAERHYLDRPRCSWVRSVMGPWETQAMMSWPSM